MVIIADSEFIEQIEHCLPALQSYCRRLAGNNADGEDLYQITLEKAYHSYKDNSGISKALLYRIAKNATIDSYRKKRIEQTELIEDTLLSCNENELLVREAFEVIAERLSVRQSVLLLMIDVFGFSAKETARLIRSTEGAVKEALKRARRLLAQNQPEPAAVPLRKVKIGGSREYMTSELMELFIHAFRDGDVKQIYSSYLSLIDNGIKVAGVMQAAGFYSFDFIDPNGHLMQIQSKIFL